MRWPQVTGQGRSRVRAANQNLPFGREASSPDGSLGEAASARELAQRWLWSPGQPAPTGANGQSEALFMPVFTVLFSIVCEHTHTHTISPSSKPLTKVKLNEHEFTHQTLEHSWVKDGKLFKRTHTLGSSQGGFPECFPVASALKGHRSKWKTRMCLGGSPDAPTFCTAR